MSAFLGPIHHWLYNKIQIQQDIVENITTLAQKELSELNLNKELEVRFGVSEKRPLEQVIDEGNIHGWLQSRVSQVEYKLAYSITQILKLKPELFIAIEEVFKKKGEEIAKTLSFSNVSEVYKAMNDSLLDGMPCDHANSLLEDDGNRVVWKRNTCVHHNYWEEVDGDINNYYKFREAFIRGMLTDSKYTFKRSDDVTFMIEKE